MTDRGGINVVLRHQGPIPLDVEFSCAAGELLALVGPSGSGKSTVLRAIAGLFRPDHGAITCNGDVWFDQAAGIDVATRLRRTGFVFQNFGLFPHLTALENVMEGLIDLAAPSRRDRAHELLSRVHLAGLEDRKPGQLSGGQQQRVAVARALARDPHVLLLDEPFSAVDKATRQRLYKELVDLRRQLDMPVILVTHDLDEAALLADRLCILHHGKTLQSGPPFDVMARPASGEVARLVDQKNIFSGTVAGHDGAADRTLVTWGAVTLVARHQPEFSVGQELSWMIPAADVRVHRIDQPPREDSENTITGIISDVTRLGDQAGLSLAIDAASALPLFLSIRMAYVKRHGLEIGDAVTVSLNPVGIHLME